MQDFMAIDGVNAVHDLHVWALKPGMLMLAMHAEVLPSNDAGVVLSAIIKTCQVHGVQHSTVQLFKTGSACPCLPSANAVSSIPLPVVDV